MKYVLISAIALAALPVLGLAEPAPPMLIAAGAAQDDALRASMEADNAKWLEAYNTNNPKAYLSMYAKDAILLPPGAALASGREAIEQFWESRLKAGNRKDHNFEILSIRQDGNLAYQVARWTVLVQKDGGEPVKLSGNTLRVFERQPDGAWLTKVHAFNLDK